MRLLGLVWLIFNFFCKDLSIVSTKVARLKMWQLTSDPCSDVPVSKSLLEEAEKSRSYYLQNLFLLSQDAVGSKSFSPIPFMLTGTCGCTQPEKLDYVLNVKGGRLLMQSICFMWWAEQRWGGDLQIDRCWHFVQATLLLKTYGHEGKKLSGDKQQRLLLETQGS